jgi:hypothetical protein
MRAAYPEWNPLDRQAEVNRIYDSIMAKRLIAAGAVINQQYEDAFAGFVAQGCVCVDAPGGPVIPAGQSVRCPVHPSRTVRRGPVGHTN